MLKVGNGRKMFGRVTSNFSSGPAPFNPLDLSPVFFYDLTDLSSMWQDIPGTVPVTAVGDPIARVDDQFLTGKFLAQAIASDRPLLAQDGNGFYFVRGDGIGDSLATFSASEHPDFAGSVEATIFIAHKQRAGLSSYAGIYTFSNINTNGSLAIYESAGGTRYFDARGDQMCEAQASGLGSGIQIMTQIVDASPGNPASSALQVEINGVTQSLSYPSNQPPNSIGSTATFLKDQLSLFKLVGTAFSGGGDAYMMIGYNYLLTADQRSAVVDWINARCGAF